LPKLCRHAAVQHQALCQDTCSYSCSYFCCASGFDSYFVETQRQFPMNYKLQVEALLVVLVVPVHWLDHHHSSRCFLHLGSCSDLALLPYSPHLDCPGDDWICAELTAAEA